MDITESIVEAFLRRLKEKMAGRDLTNQALAELVDVSPQKIGRILKRKQDLKLPLLLQICNVLGIKAGATLDASIAEARPMPRLAVVEPPVPDAPQEEWESYHKQVGRFVDA